MKLLRDTMLIMSLFYSACEVGGSLGVHQKIKVLFINQNYTISKSYVIFYSQALRII